MENRTGSHRRRPIMACWECHRRKQKCNRGRPCNVCVARKVPDKCTYGQPASPIETRPPRTQTPRHGSSRSSDDLEQMSETSSLPTLLDRLGYSGVRESSVMEDSHRLNQGERGTSQVFKEQSRVLPPLAKEKFCDIAAQLPPEFIVRELVDAFFSKGNWYFNLLEQHYFDKLYNIWRTSGSKNVRLGRLEDLSPDLLYFPALLFQVLAIGIMFLPAETSSANMLQIDDDQACDLVSQKYSDKGMDVMVILGRHDATITAVQHDLLRCFWLKNSGRAKESWHVMGSGIRMAQELGLHLQSEIRQEASSSVNQTLTRLWYDEYKRRVWVKLFAWDSHMALALGRPRTINITDCTAKTPIDCSFPSDPSSTVPMQPGEQDPPSSFTPQLCQYFLAQKMHEVISGGLNKRHAKDYEKVTTIHNQVVSMLDNLPPAMRGENPDTSWDMRLPRLPAQRQHIRNNAYAFLLNLHRPHARIHDASREAAVKAALTILDAQEKLFNILGDFHHKVYMLSFYTVDASLFLAVTTVEYPVESQLQLAIIHHALKSAIDRLSWMKIRSSLAKLAEPLLRHCFGMVEKSAPLTVEQENQSNINEDSANIDSTPFSGNTYINESSMEMTDSPSYNFNSSMANQTEFPMLNFDALQSSSMFMSLTDPSYDFESFMKQLADPNDASLDPNMNMQHTWPQWLD